MLTLILVIAVALAFDFTNGFHDAANAIATAVATRSISPRLAVVLAGALNFLGAFVSIKVAATIGSKIIDPGAFTLPMVTAGLVGAIVWNLVTWGLGLPSSSSHALVGGIGGAAIAEGGGTNVVLWDGVVEKVLKPSIVAPILGFLVAGILVLLLGGPIWRAVQRVRGAARGLQLASAGFVAFTHGTNDAQKTMGVIVVALVAGGKLDAADPKHFSVPTWVIVASALAMAAGTYAGGWRIIRTLGTKIHALDLRSGTAAQAAAGAVLYATASAGFPVSTTQTITGSVLGTGVAHRFRLTRWAIARRILVAWITTMPAAALLGALGVLITRVPGGTVVLALVTLAALAVIVYRRRAEMFGRPEQPIDEAPPASGAEAVPSPHDIVAV